MKIMNQLKGLINEKMLALLLAKLVTRNNILKLLDALEALANKTSTRLDNITITKIREILNSKD